MIGIKIGFILLALLVEGLVSVGAYGYSSSRVTKEWTFLVYLDGDNNLEGAGIDDLNEMEMVGSDENINIIVQFDRHPRYDTTNGNWTICRRYYVTKDDDPNIIKSLLLEDMGEVNMAAPETLVDFINFGYENFPAKRYALILWNHGDGWREKIKELRKRGIRIDGANKAVCVDETSNYDCLYMDEVKEALKASNKRIHLIGFDACLMGMIEVAYQVRDYGDVVVFSQEVVPSDGWPYHTILTDLKEIPTMSPAELGKVIVERYAAEYKGLRYPTQSAVDLKKLHTLASKTSAFADTLEYYWDEIRTARKMTKVTFIEIFGYPHADLYDFTDLVDEIDDIDIKNTALELKLQLSEAIIANYSLENFKGLSIYFPENSRDLQYEEYVELKPVDFPNDTTWDEFLIRFCNITVGIPKIDPLYSVGINTDFKVSWSSVPEVLYYELQEAGTKTISGWYTIATTTKTSYLIPGKLKQGFYYYRVRAITNPEYGNWSFPEDIWVGPNIAPTITLTYPPPEGTTTDKTCLISWQDSDLDDNAKIDLYYDKDKEGYDGTLIVKGIEENSETNTYLFNTSFLPNGTYFIYAVISDGKEKERKSPPVYSNYSGPLTIKHTTHSWTFLVYLDGDNYLEKVALNEIEAMKMVGSSDNVNIIAQLDGIDIHPNAKRYYILKDDAKVVEELSEVNMGNPNTVIDFANWAISGYPAENYAFVFMNYGGGWRTEEKSKPYLDKIKRADKAVCWDATSNWDCLYMSEVKEALSKTKAKINLVGFDASFMGMLEVAYEIKDYAEVMVASQERYFPGWPYKAILQDLITTPTMTPQQLGAYIVDRFGEHHDKPKSAIDLSKIALLASATSKLADEIIYNWDTMKYTIKEARENTQATRRRPNYVDLYHFASLIKNATVTDTLNKVVIKNYAGSAHQNFHGLSIYFPKTKGDWEYIEYVEDQVIDFPKDTKWYEFLKFYTDEFKKGYFTGSYTERILDEDADGKYDYLVIDAKVFIDKEGYYGCVGELMATETSIVGWGRYSYLSQGTHTVSVKFLGPKIFASKISGKWKFKTVLLDIDTLIGTTSYYNYSDFEATFWSIINGTISYYGTKSGNLWYFAIHPEEVKKLKKGKFSDITKFYGWTSFDGPGSVSYTFYCPPGTWSVFSILDVNRNEWYDIGEPVGIYGSLCCVYLVEVNGRYTIEIIGTPTVITLGMSSIIENIDFELTHEIVPPYGIVTVYDPNENFVGTYTTIQGAINACPLGGTVYVSSGIYREAIYINKNIALIGTGTPIITVKGLGPTNTVTFDKATASISGFIIIGASGKGNKKFLVWEKENKKFLTREEKSKEFFVGNCNGIFCISSSVIITNNIISRNDHFGILCENSLVTITNNTILQNNVGMGFFTSSATITNNTISKNIDVGIYCDKNSSLTITNNIISENDLSIGGVNSSLTIINNTISNNNDIGVGCFNSYITMTNNIISGNKDEGIYSYDSFITITNNIISWNNTTGICCYDSFIILTNNTISGNNAHGVYCGWNSLAIITNNIITENGTRSDNAYGIYNNARTLIINYNCVWGNGVGEPGAQNYYKCSPGPHDIQNDPQFIGKGDFRLKRTSPCIDRGTNTAHFIPEKDKDGNPRIVNGIVDMGAYEFQGPFVTITRTLKDAFVFPNPYIPTKGHKYVCFTNLTDEAVIRIYDISGALIKELEAKDGKAYWNPKEDGIASGVYIYVIKDSKERKTGKLAIIR